VLAQAKAMRDVRVLFRAFDAHRKAMQTQVGTYIGFGITLVVECSGTVGMQAKQLSDRETELLHLRGVVDRDRK
jgi:hypothetical protein